MKQVFRFTHVNMTGKEIWIFDKGSISCLKDVKYHGCENELAHLQTSSVSRKKFLKNTIKINSVKGQGDKCSL